MGYSRIEWLRVVQQQSWSDYILGLKPSSLAVLEISPGHNSTWKQFKFKKYQAVDYPDFDICTTALGETFDLILADNVFEHIPDPISAISNVRKMLKPNGSFLAGGRLRLAVAAVQRSGRRPAAPAQPDFRIRLPTDLLGARRC